MAQLEELAVYQALSEFRRRTYRIAERLRKTHPKRAGQFDDAVRSSKQNFVEGYKKDSLGEFIHSCQIARASFAEALEDLSDFSEDGLLKPDEKRFVKDRGRRTAYLLDRFIDSLWKMKKSGAWKQRWNPK